MPQPSRVPWLGDQSRVSLHECHIEEIRSCVSDPTAGRRPLAWGGILSMTLRSAGAAGD